MTEIGEISKQGRRSDIVEAVALLHERKRMREVAQAKWSRCSDGGEDQGAEEAFMGHGEGEEAPRQFLERAVSRERLVLSAHSKGTTARIDFVLYERSLTTEAVNPLGWGLVGVV